MSSDEVKKHLLKFNPSKFKNAFYVQILQFWPRLTLEMLAIK